MSLHEKTYTTLTEYAGDGRMGREDVDAVHLAAVLGTVRPSDRHFDKFV